MILNNEITVPAPASAVFDLVNDVEAVTSCVPGATLQGRDGEDYLGSIKVKVGPITASYRGRVRFVEVDPERRLVRLSATGADAHGNGDAEATVNLTVDDAGDGARIVLVTDLIIRGKIAQFGKGVIPAVSGRLLQAFAVNLAALLTQPVPSGSGAATGHGVSAAADAAARVPDAAAGVPAIDGIGFLVPAWLAGRGPVIGAFFFGVFQGWLVSRAFGPGRATAPRCGGDR